MTYEEALRWTDDSLSQGKVLPEQESYAYMGVVKIALEKQIAKKPRLKGGQSNNMDVRMLFDCPACGRILELEPIDRNEEVHCLHCGQAIDWSEDK